MIHPPYHHFLDLSDASPVLMRRLLDAAHARKAARAGLSSGAPDADMPLAMKLLVMIFEKPSTRTRLSFDIAMRQLGGAAIVLNQNDLQLGRGESIADTARVISRYADAIMIRTSAHESLIEFANAAEIPVINALTDFSHPCQILADLMTFEQHKGALTGAKLAWVGDGNNVAVSFIHAAIWLGFELHLAIPDAYRPPPSVMDWIDAHKDGDKYGRVVFADTVHDAMRDAAAVITDCWVSMGDDSASAQARARAFAPYQVTSELMALSDDAIFMHCLPVYRGQEVTADVIDGKYSVVFDEAENRIHAQKAILTYVLGVFSDA